MLTYGIGLEEEAVEECTVQPEQCSEDQFESDVPEIKY